MSNPAESRAILGHLINVSMPFSKENPIWVKVCSTEELDEKFNPDTDDIQYICDTTKTTILKGYKPELEIKMLYQKNNLLQNYFNTKVRKLPLGAENKIEYIRFNKDETKYGTENEFIGVRREATVYFESLGGSAKDPLASVMKLYGAGDGEVGYIKVEDTGNSVKYTWETANLDIPTVSTIGGVDITTYYQNNLPEVELTTDTTPKLVITGKGTVNATVKATFNETSANDDPTPTPDPRTPQVGPDGIWRMEVPSLTRGKIYTTAFWQELSGGKSVTTNMFKFKIKVQV